MDIEDRAVKWVRANFSAEYLAGQDEGFMQALVDAYLADVAQARQDEAAHQEYLRNLPIRPGQLKM